MNADTLINIGITLLISAGTGYFAFRIQFERFQSMDTERLKHWERWRESIDKRIDVLESSTLLTEMAVMEAELAEGNEDRKGIRFWKHSVVDPYIPGAFDALKARVDRIQEYLNGKLAAYRK